MALALLTACSTGEPRDSELEAYLCDQNDVGDQYIELTRGEFTPRDLADLGDNADSKEREFTEAGMLGGQFIFFKQSLPKPPFDPPLDVVCQVLEFENAPAAEAWLDRLDETNVAATVFTSQVLGPSRVVERELDPGPLASAFVAFGSAEGWPSSVSLVVAAEGRYVRTLAIGGTGQLDRQVEATWAAWTEN